MQHRLQFEFVKMMVSSRVERVGLDLTHKAESAGEAARDLAGSNTVALKGYPGELSPFGFWRSVTLDFCFLNYNFYS